MSSLSSAFRALVLTASCAIASAAAAQATLYTQAMSAGGGILRASQLWIDPSGQNDLDSDAIAWENFTLSESASITRVRWCGQALPPLGFRISFFNQDPNTIAMQPDMFAPGSGPISQHNYASPSVQSLGGGLYQFTVDLVTPLTFEANKRYFISIVGRTPVPYAEWKWAQSPTANGGTFWWSRGAHMYFHLGDDRALELLGNVVTLTPVAYDGFGGPPATDLNGSTSGTGWTGPWLDQSGDTVTGVGATGLSYASLESTPGAAVTAAGATAYPMSVYSRAFSQVPAGTNQIYVSFLMRADAGYGSGGGLTFGGYPYAMSVGAPAGMYTFGLMLSEGLGDLSNAPLVEGETNLVVVRISKNTPAAGITYKLFLNPVIGQGEPSSALAQYGVGAVSALPTSLRIDNGGGFTTDEIRVGTTWTSVLPAGQANPADLNQDGTVDGADLGALLGNWSNSGLGDLNGDGLVDGGDLGLLLGAWTM